MPSKAILGAPPRPVPALAPIVRNLGRGAFAMTTQHSVSGCSTFERVRAHYEIERELAQRLRQAPLATRGKLYHELYEELFRRVPDHPQTARTRADKQRRVARSRRLIRRWLEPETVYMEIGAGDCELALSVAQRVRHVYAIDVSETITSGIVAPSNFDLVLTDGVTMPVPDGSIDLAFSDQLMEHLHPDDALQQLANIHRALRPGGRYVCLTPSRHTGPHDVSRSFDRVATGFHLEEYDYRRLIQLLRQVGFTRMQILIGSQGRVVALPARCGVWIETAMRPLTGLRWFRFGRVAAALFGVKIVARR